MTIHYDAPAKVFRYTKTDIHYPTYQIYMPLNKDGHGPASPEETTLETWEVWDQVCQCICKCNSKEDAAYIARLINHDMDGPL